MRLDLAQLRALRATVDAGTLDAAAEVLHVTPSAVSQRIKALESAAGRVLLVRSRPVRVTRAGRAVLRLARQVDLLAAETANEIGDEPAHAPVELAIAVNADSLGTWLLPALAELRESITFDLYREDQDQTALLLREGTVVAAVTAADQPVGGCPSTPLGVLRYRPAATPTFAQRWFPDGTTPAALGQAPMVNFDRDDDLQRRFLREHGDSSAATRPTHHVPTSDGFEQAVIAGFGWGMLTEAQLERLEPNQLTLLDPQATVDVPLYWQRWKLRPPSLDRLTHVVVTAGRAAQVPAG
ncbi:MAG: LysR family transcriptional regulator ArgP [Nitriliruptor sp.]